MTKHTRKTISIDRDRLPEAPNPEVLCDKLLLVGLEVPLEAIEKWTPTDKILAANWAEATHLVASDNVLNEFCRAHDDETLNPAPACICLPAKPTILGGEAEANCPNCGISPFAGKMNFFQVPTGNYLVYLICAGCGVVIGCQLADAALLFPKSDLAGPDGRPVTRGPKVPS